MTLQLGKFHQLSVLVVVWDSFLAKRHITISSLQPNLSSPHTRTTTKAVSSSHPPILPPHPASPTELLVLIVRLYSASHPTASSPHSTHADSKNPLQYANSLFFSSKLLCLEMLVYLGYFVQGPGVSVRLSWRRLSASLCMFVAVDSGACCDGGSRGVFENLCLRFGYWHVWLSVRYCTALLCCELGGI